MYSAETGAPTTSLLLLLLLLLHSRLHSTDSHALPHRENKRVKKKKKNLGNWESNYRINIPSLLVNPAWRRPHPLSLVPLSTYIRYQEFGVGRSFACVVIYSSIIFNNGEGLAPLPFDPIIRTPQNPKLYRLPSLLDPLICWERQKLTSNEALSCEISDR